MVFDTGPVFVSTALQFNFNRKEFYADDKSRMKLQPFSYTLGSEKFVISRDQFSMKLDSSALYPDSKNPQLFNKELLLSLFEGFIYDGNDEDEAELAKIAGSNPNAILGTVYDQDISSEIRANAVRILIETGKGNLIQTLFEYSYTQKYPIIRMGLLYGLIEIGLREMISLMCNDPDQRISSAAFSYLQNNG